MNRLCRQADIKIAQDWSAVRKFYNTLLEKLDRGDLDKDKTYIKEVDSIQYGLNKFGSLIMSHHLSPRWGFATGELFEKLLPWADDAKKIFSPLNMQDIAWSVTNTNVKLHTDSRVEGEEKFDICKINYIVSAEDPTAKTVVYDLHDQSYSEQYPSTVGTAWLLDVLHPHEIFSNSHREIIQFKFLNPYAEVAEFLNSVGPIRLGNF